MSGQFARLLPSLEVAAVSLAPSPESNPNSLLPVTAMEGQYPTFRERKFVLFGVLFVCCWLLLLVLLLWLLLFLTRSTVVSI